jgi:CRP/FNR family transcriptional regulator
MPTDLTYLKSYSCFENLTGEQLGTIAEFTDAVCYLPGQILFEEGLPGESVFFLREGEVEVIFNIEESGQVQVDTVSGQEVIGCSALIKPYLYTATERSITQVEVLEVNAKAMRELMQSDCQLGFMLQSQIIKILMERILTLRLKAIA